jgi:hypothetical protein
MDVYKILRTAGLEYVPAKEAVSAAMSPEQRASHERLLDAAEEAARASDDQ